MSQDTKEINLVINDKKIVAKSGMTVFQAAQLAGIFIPHYCYHSDLSIAGVCRMCMCEIEKNPRLQISCNTLATEGMVVKTDTEKVKETVQGILELHLINHPLDCPICDKAGECKLQDYYEEYGLYKSRMPYETKNHKPKVVDIGSIILDDERCILCTRCVRFTAEVTKTHELGIFNRGDRSVLRTFDEKPLRNEYTGNLADICPVGALTAKEFRFKQRVWFLDRVDSVCTQCARGCNTTISVNPDTRKLYRIEPRRNPDVNQSWMCDTGRWNNHYVYADNRLKNPKKNVGAKLLDATWNQFFTELRAEIDTDPEKVLVVLSTFLTNEEIADAVESFQSIGVKNFAWVVDESLIDDKAPYDGILKHRDATPNVQGFEKVMQGLKVKWLRQPEILEKTKANAFSRVLFLGLEGQGMPGMADLLLKIPSSVRVAIHATTHTPFFERADWVLPNTSSFEKSGTMVNVLGIMQKLVAALPWVYTSRDAHALVFGIKEGHDRNTCPTTRFQTVFKALSNETIFPGARTDWKKMPASGVNIGVVGRAEGIKHAKR